MTYTSDDFKPVDLAALVCANSRTHSGGSGRHDAAKYGPCADHKRIVGEVCATYTVLAPGERVTPEGSVVLDPEDRKAVARFCGFWSREHGWACIDAESTKRALRALAAEQNAPEVPEPPHDAILRDRHRRYWRYPEQDDDGRWIGAGWHAAKTWEELHAEHGPVTVYRPQADQ